MKALISLLLLSQAIKVRDDDYDFYSDAPSSANLDKDFDKLGLPDQPARSSDSKPADNKNVATGEAIEKNDEEQDDREKKLRAIKKEIENDSTFFTSQADITKKEKDADKKKIEVKPAKSKD